MVAVVFVEGDADLAAAAAGGGSGAELGGVSEGVLRLLLPLLLFRAANFRAIQTFSVGEVAVGAEEGELEFVVPVVVFGEFGDRLVSVEEEVRPRPFSRPPREAFSSQASAGVKSPFNAGSGRPMRVGKEFKIKIAAERRSSQLLYTTAIKY